jgi:hypothetical protein
MHAAIGLKSLGQFLYLPPPLCLLGFAYGNVT